jgi:hypothetical protein
MHVIDTCMLVVTACRGKRIVPLYPSSDTSQPASEHVPNRYMSMFYSRMISGLERRLVKMIKIKCVSCGLSGCRVVNPLWLLPGPKKLPEAKIVSLITEGRSEGPVHPCDLIYRKLAGAIQDMANFKGGLLYQRPLAENYWETHPRVDVCRCLHPRAPPP